jgi:nicotinic acid mononucleotide adenylyltransferase
VDAAMVLEGSGSGESSHTSGAIFPGAFHPLHYGHRRIAEFAKERLHKSIEFEISVDNVDKPPLDYTEISERLRQFTSDDTVWLTRAPTFVEKAKIFPGGTFIVGADTIERIADPRYYDNADARDAALSELETLDCRFMVFGRKTSRGFRTLADLSLPSALAQLCDEVSSDEFREDISSTELRAKELGD